MLANRISFWLNINGKGLRRITLETVEHSTVSNFNCGECCFCGVLIVSAYAMQVPD